MPVSIERGLVDGFSESWVCVDGGVNLIGGEFHFKS